MADMTNYIADDIWEPLDNSRDLATIKLADKKTD